ncbi:ABC transporter permease [Dyadobacter arcticus]|uniref:ABC transport system permease protein n=1 Tax=Dyadobacter arcticus TaxID=1078754 RepID=A0ABX0UP85_9BACT|nr:ABC transporter permease [Dyadobacter arcticus]NIJ54803.1 putative ABC transport system permease protein [Dyadobacter arcticus]
MIKNYFKIAWRNMLRNKAFSAINIVGLSLGVAACLLILQYVAFELSYDNFHKNGAQIYRVQQDRYNEGKLSTQWAAGAYAVGNSFKDAFPEVQDYVKLLQRGKSLLDYGDKSIKIENYFVASSSFFYIFSYPLLIGNPQTALAESNTIVLSESLSKRLFGKENPLGKTIKGNKRKPFKVSGVFKDMPANSHFKTELLMSYATFLADVKPDNPDIAWQWDGCLTYIKIRPGTDTKALEAKFPALIDKLAGADHKKYKSAAVYLLQPLRDIHLYSHLMMEAEANGDGKTVYLLLGIAFFIVVIAWVNYINLATARAINRAKEVGVRKAVGSLRGQLIGQFMTESFLLNGLAVILALILVALALPKFNEISGQQLSFALLGSKMFWLPLTGLFVIGAFFSGLYPAFILSGFKPVAVLKGKVLATRQGVVLRKSLVVFQFAASLFLLVGTLAVFQQIRYMRAQSLGINIDQTLVVNPPIVADDSTYMRQLAAFKDELLRQSNVKGITASTVVPGQASDWNAGGIRLKGTDEGQGKQYRIIGVDYDFLKTYDLKLIAGRNFSKEFGSDPKAVVFNKMAIQQLGFSNPEDAIGKEIDFWGEIFTVVGVTDNFHQQSLRDAYEPLILRLIPDLRGYFSIKMAGGPANGAVASVREEWNKFFPGNPFEYAYLDDRFNEQYKADQRFGQVFGIFTGLAILVACLGLFGLASFTTAQRTKEIGIRKVLGSSVFSIVEMLYREFVILIAISFVVATPLAWFAVSQWLDGYAFRTDIQWWLFLIPFAAVLVIALLTVSFQSIKAALTNPVTSLRSE